MGEKKRVKVRKSVRVEGRTLRIVTPLLPVDRIERLDRHRVILHVSPMVRVLCAGWSSPSAIRSLLLLIPSDAQS